MFKDYRDERILNVIEPIGYEYRVGNYYVLAEDDGYINIHYYYNDKLYINFHKNYYHGKNISDAEHNHDFNNYSDFFKFLQSYHKQYFRKIKIKQLNDK